MKLRLSLKWNLTLGIIAIWVVFVIFILFRVNWGMKSLNDDINSELIDSLITKGTVIANSLTVDIANQNTNNVKDFLKKNIKDNPNILFLAVLDSNKKPLFFEGQESKSQFFLEYVNQVSPKGVFEADKRTIVGLVPIEAIKGQSIGYLFIVKNIGKFLDRTSSFFIKLFLTALGWIVVVGIFGYYIGYKLTKPINVLVSAAERIADGDLEKAEIETTGLHELHKLGSSIQKMAEAMRLQVSSIKNLTAKISEISKETEGAMTDLASSAAQQAAAVNETAATVEEMEKAGQSSATNAKHIVAAAEKTAEASKKGRQTVEKTYEIIMQIKDESHDISEKSKNLLNSVEEVGNIIQSVNSIAEQSKILAVNASIEAAKAGEFGSGFAVVAQEVKDLAQQSKDATLQITGTLTAIRAAIETMVVTAQRGKDRTAEGVNTIANAGTVMNDLSEAIRENSDFAKLIATNIQQQTIGLTQIAAAIEEINTSALENQSISRNIVHSTKQLSETLGLLTNMVDRWKISN